MTDLQWDLLRKIIGGEIPQTLPVGFIIDSPWLPNWYGCRILDYFSNDQLWLDANLKPGETVLDLGSGAGFDLLLAALKVEPSGRAIGVEMTAAMREKARFVMSVMQERLQGLGGTWDRVTATAWVGHPSSTGWSWKTPT